MTGSGAPSSSFYVPRGGRKIAERIVEIDCAPSFSGERRTRIGRHFRRTNHEISAVNYEHRYLSIGRSAVLVVSDGH
jgi:hypothetical protein